MTCLQAEARRLANTVIWSWDGWRAAWATEKTLRQWTMANVLSAALAFSLDLTPAERALILALGLLILAAELINTGAGGGGRPPVARPGPTGEEGQGLRVGLRGADGDWRRGWPGWWCWWGRGYRLLAAQMRPVQKRGSDAL